MRLIRPARRSATDRWTLALALGMLIAGVTAVGMMLMLPPDRLAAVAALGAAAALGLGVGIAWLVRALTTPRGIDGEDLAALLAPAFDNSYVLLLNPRLPDVPADLGALLVGPAGVRAIVVRRWQGRYRVRGRAWDYDTRSRRGWIACRTNPSFEADAVANAVGRWAERVLDEASLPIAPAVAFPRSWSSLLLEEPDGEIVTHDNAPWWAQRIGRVQRMDAARAARFVQAVIDAGERTARHAPARPVPTP